MFQRYSLFPWLTVRRNISYGLEELGVPRTERDRIVAEHVRLVHLEGFEDRYPRELSGGMQQRVALAQTLVCQPDILLMDEPFGALDAQTRRILQDEMRRIWRRDTKTVLFVTHDVEEAVALGTRIVVMGTRPGRIKEVIERNFERCGQRRIRIQPAIRRAQVAYLAQHPGGSGGDPNMKIVPLLLVAIDMAGGLHVGPAANGGATLLGLCRCGARFVWSHPGEIFPHTAASFFRAGTGFFLAVIVGIALGLTMARVRAVQRAVEPILLSIYPVPKPALIPLFMVWLGIGDLSKITVIALSCLVPVVISAFNGARAVDDILFWSARARGTAEHRLLWRVVLPAALPQIATGVRTAIAIALIVMVSSEFISAEHGLGYLIFTYGGVGSDDAMLAVVLYLTAIGFLIDRVYVAGLRRLMAWHAFAH